MDEAGLGWGLRWGPGRYANIVGFIGHGEYPSGLRSSVIPELVYKGLDVVVFVKGRVDAKDQS